MLPLVREPGCGVKGLSAAAVVSVSVATSREIDAPSAGAQELSTGLVSSKQPWPARVDDLRLLPGCKLKVSMCGHGHVETLNFTGFDYRSCSSA